MEEVLPLAPLQHGLLFHAVYDGADDGSAGGDVYVGQIPLLIDGDLDAPRLRAAFQSLVDRHAALRAGFAVRAEREPVQVIAAHAPVPWTAFDLRSLDAGQRGARARELLAADRAARFDVTRPPLIRVTLLRLTEQRHLLLLTGHHLVWDGWSMTRALGDVLTHYDAHGAPGALPRSSPTAATSPGCPLRTPTPRSRRGPRTWRTCPSRRSWHPAPPRTRRCCRPGW